MRRGRPLTFEQLLACRRLEEFAPGLARARDRLRAEWVQRSVLRDAVLRREWLVAHRELQLVRAFAVGKGAYIARRQRKLTAARKELRAYERRLEAAERRAA